MKYAVIQTGGKQYKVSEGDILDVEKLSGKPNDRITLGEVLLLNDDGVVTLGKPFISGFQIVASLVEATRGPKIRVSNYKAKVRYRSVTGHRQHLSRIKIESIGKMTESKGQRAERQEDKKEVIATKPMKETAAKK